MIEISILLILLSKGTGEFSLEKTKLLKAVLPFFIIACHYCPNVLPIENNISFLGYYAVSIFFFISGYGLSLKINTVGELPFNYIITKLLLLMIPLLSTTLLYVLISYYFSGVFFNLNIFACLSRGYFIHPISWFVIKLMVLYIFMYLSSKFNHKTFVLLFLILLFMGFEKYYGIQSTYYISDLAFWAGCIYKKSDVISWNIWIRKTFYILLVILMLIFPTMVMPFICLCLPIFFVSLFCTIKIQQNAVYSYLGKISYELYLVQISAAIIINHILVTDSLSQRVVAFILICVLSIILASFIKPLDTLLSKNIHEMYYVRFNK